MESIFDISRLLPSLTDSSRENPLSRAQPAGKLATATPQASARSLRQSQARQTGVHRLDVDSSITLSPLHRRGKLVCVAPYMIRPFGGGCVSRTRMRVAQPSRIQCTGLISGIKGHAEQRLHTRHKCLAEGRREARAMRLCDLTRFKPVSVHRTALLPS